MPALRDHKFWKSLSNDIATTFLKENGKKCEQSLTYYSAPFCVIIKCYFDLKLKEVPFCIDTYPVWPDGLIVSSIFGHSQQRKFAH